MGLRLRATRRTPPRGSGDSVSRRALDCSDGKELINPQGPHEREPLSSCRSQPQVLRSKRGGFEDRAMIAAGLDVFDRTLHKTYDWLADLMRVLAVDDRHVAYQ